MMTLKGVPSTYDKDLQEDKEPLFDSADTLSRSLRILEGVVATLDVHPAAMRAALTDDLLATDLAEYLVRKGVRPLGLHFRLQSASLNPPCAQMPFRETHHISGSAVRLAETRGSSLSKLSLADLQGLSALFTDDVAAVFDFEASVERRDVVGGTSRRAVLEQVAKAKAALGI
jgi:argininosuccinate lyase